MDEEILNKLFGLPRVDGSRPFEDVDAVVEAYPVCFTKDGPVGSDGFRDLEDCVVCENPFTASTLEFDVTPETLGPIESAASRGALECLVDVFPEKTVEIPVIEDVQYFDETEYIPVQSRWMSFFRWLAVLGAVLLFVFAVCLLGYVLFADWSVTTWR